MADSTNQSAQVAALATRIGNEIKATKATIGTLTSLSTTDTKTSLTTTFSSTKIASDIEAAKNAVKNDLLNGAGEAYDTLKELGELIDTNKSAIDALKDTAAGHVRFNAAQTLTDPQKKQARTNIGAADATTVSDHATRLTAVEKKAGDTETALNALKAAVGDTTTDYVAAFEAALNATE